MLAALATALTPTMSRGAPAVAAGPAFDVRLGVAVRDTLWGSGAQDNTVVNADLALDPNDRGHLVGVYQMDQFADGGAAGTGFGVSQGGAQNWTYGILPGLTTATGGSYDRAESPRVEFAPDGTVFAVSRVFGVGDCRSGIGLNVSSDGGYTWSVGVFVDERTGCEQADGSPGITVDLHAGSAYHGRLYVTWDVAGAALHQILLISSDDLGQQWTAPMEVSPEETLAGPPTPLMQPDGDLTIYYPGEQATRELVQTSHDGGATFDPPVVAGGFQGGDPPDMRTGASIGLGSATVDPVTGYLYIVWQDRRFNRFGLNDIVMVVSLDGGATWTPVRRINRDANVAIDHFTPTISAYGGVVTATYYHRYVDDPMKVERGFTFSMANGRKWSPRRELDLYQPGVAEIDLAYAAVVDGKYFLGDYQGAATALSAVHVFWAVSQPGATPQQQAGWGATVFLRP